VVLIAALLVWAVWPAQPAAASTGIGGQLYSTGGTVTVTYNGSNAGYTSDLYLYSPSVIYIATGHITPVGTQVTIGPFTAGDELIFGIYVWNTGHTFYMGPGSRNPDTQPHANVVQTGPNDFDVGFEDLFGGGDRDYDDILFHFSGSLAPDPVVDTDGDGVIDADDNCPTVPNTD
jgi:hypothetical protein